MKVHRGAAPQLAATRASVRRRRLLIAASAVIGVGVIAAGAALASGGAGGAASSPTSRPLIGSDLHSLVADPTTQGRLYVGGHSAVAVSTDDGASWSQVASLDGADAMGWGFADPAVLVSGHTGVRRSTGPGEAFVEHDRGLPDTDVHALGASPSIVYLAGPAFGLAASTDGASSWTLRSGAAGRSFSGRLLVDPDDDRHVLAADARSGVLETMDGGVTWRSLDSPGGASWLSRGPAGLYASGDGAAVSTDGGVTWRALTELPRRTVLVEADPTRAGVLYAADLVGQRAEIWRSQDGGATWRRSP